jgi:putative CocE/NonD family hydrolase
MKNSFLLLVLLLFSAALNAAEKGETDDYVRSHYAKYEYRIPMRDGVKLFTAVYIPYDKSRKYPILLLRTPYSVGPYGADKYKKHLGPSDEFDKEGFIFVFQDVRGRFMSEGEFLNMRPHLEKKGAKDTDESTDTYDTIEWLLKNIPNHNGKVGQWGISYPGFYTSAGMINSHPALKAVSPQAPIADWFWDDIHHNGAFILPLGFDFFSVFGQKRDGLTTRWPDYFDFGTIDGYKFYLEVGSLANVQKKYFRHSIAFWDSITAHPDYDSFWQRRNLLPHLKNIKPAVLVVGGWFDAEDLYGVLSTYRAVEKNNPGIDNTLVMGPWPHGGWNRSDADKLGDLEFGFNTPEYFKNNIQFPFFMRYLKNMKVPKPAEAVVFETGANRWREFDHWPPRNLKKTNIYFCSGKRLIIGQSADDSSSFDEYISDPAHPVPYTKIFDTSWIGKYMTEDQRFASRRPDVLTYVTKTLNEDITLAGPVDVDIFVSTTGTDADWVVKVIDVFPDDYKMKDDYYSTEGGKETLIRGDVFRGRFRNSFEKPEPMNSGEITEIKFRLWDLFHTFLKGHKIMIQVQSTWFPLVDRNPQKYVENIYKAKESDFIKAKQRIYYGKKYPSHLNVGVLKRGD